MKLSERMQRSADNLIASVTADIRHAMRFEISDLSEDEWNDIYAGMGEEIRPYLCTKDGVLSIEVQYGPNVGDNKFFAMSDVVADLGDTDENLEALASKVEALAAVIRARKFA